MLKKIFYYFFLTLTINCSLFAVEIPAHPLKVAELIDMAMSNNLDTRQAWWNAKRAAALLGASRSTYYPTIGIDADLTNGRDFKFINGPDTEFTNAGVNLTLDILLYDYGQRAAGVEAAKMALIAANWQSDWTLQKVLVQVLENTYAVLNLQESLAAAQISSEDAAKMLEASKLLNQAGLSPITDVYTSQAQVAQARMEVIQQRNSLEIEKGKLASSLGLKAHSDFSLASINDLPILQEKQLNQLMQIAMQQRSDLLAKRARLAETRANEQKTRLAFRPKFSLHSRAGANHYFNDKTDGAQYLVRLSLDIPLFDGFNHVYQNRIAYADSQTSLQELAQLELNISLEVLTYSKNLQTAQEMLPFAEENLKSAQQAYQGVLEIYQAGKSSIAVISNALRQLATARMRYSDVRTKLMIAAANLAYSTGTLLPYMESSCEISY